MLLKKIHFKKQKKIKISLNSLHHSPNRHFWALHQRHGAFMWSGANYSKFYTRYRNLQLFSSISRQRFSSPYQRSSITLQRLDTFGFTPKSLRHWRTSLGTNNNNVKLCWFLKEQLLQCAQACLLVACGIWMQCSWRGRWIHQDKTMSAMA
jgi:hypothetical protein